MAGALTPVAVPSATFEAARDLARAREQVRLDLVRCRHRLSKLVLRHGRVRDRTAWTKTHRQWLSAQTFEHQNTELAFVDNLAACDGLVTRKQALDERLSGASGLTLIIHQPRPRSDAQHPTGQVKPSLWPRTPVGAPARC